MYGNVRILVIDGLGPAHQHIYMGLLYSINKV